MNGGKRERTNATERQATPPASVGGERRLSVSAGLSEGWRRVTSLFRRRRLEADLNEELAAHVELAVEDNVRRGMAPEEARRQARMALGGVELAKELHREARGLPTLESVAQDVRYAFRTLRRSPGFAVLAVTILALGIGANTAIFSLVSAVLLRPLPFPEPDRLVFLWDDFTARGAPSRVEPTPADYAAWKEQSHSFAGMAGLLAGTSNLTGDGDPEKLSHVRATANLFAVLGMQPLVGRTLEPYDDDPAAPPVVVVNERLWRSRFGGDPGLVGRSILLNGQAHTVVGVVPADFAPFPHQDTEVWVPAKLTAEELAARQAYVMRVVARLAPGVALSQAQSEMTMIAARLAREHPTTNADVGVAVTPAHEHLTRDVRPALLVLLGAVGLVLLIACANVANLLLARGASRRKELALREAIGAGRGRVVRLLFTESAVLAGLGVVVGVALSSLSFAYLARLVPSGLPQAGPSLDLRVLASTAGVVVLMVLGFGTGPAIVATRLRLDSALGTGTGRGTVTPRSRLLRNALVVVEMTLTVVLLVAAGLLLRSYANVLAVDPGFPPGNLLLAETVLSPSRYPTVEDRSAFCERVLERVRALPGVSAAGYANFPPLLLKGGRTWVTIEGRPEPRPEDFTKHVVSDRAVGVGYLPALGVPLIRGRHFDDRDGPGAPPAVLINQSMASLHWPSADPLGQRITVGGLQSSSPWFTVIGVVGDVRQMGLDVAPEPEFYLSFRQVTLSAPFLWPQYLTIRTERDPLALASAVRDAVWEVDPDQPVANVQSMSQVFEEELQHRNTQMTLVGAFAALALVMASVGLYGVLSYTVAQRNAEIGLRMALGAQRSDVVGAIVRNALSLAVAGLALGLLGAYALTHLLASQLFSVSPSDPVTFAAAAIVVVLTTVLASYLPARRAAGVDPVSVLK